MVPFRYRKTRPYIYNNVVRDYFTTTALTGFKPEGIV